MPAMMIPRKYVLTTAISSSHQVDHKGYRNAQDVTVKCPPFPSPVWLLTADELCSFSDSVGDALASLTGSAFPALYIPIRKL